MLANHFIDDGLIECGCDEAGRGCLAGAVFAAAVILPRDCELPLLNDSKKLTEKQRDALRPIIEERALAWAVASVSAEEIDEINVLKASHLAMHRAIDGLLIRPDRLLIDGNRFTPYQDIEAHCIVKGDGKMMNIAAASILAKTHRDKEMLRLDKEYPQYGWAKHKAYPTKAHREAIRKYGISPYHRKTFKLL